MNDAKSHITITRVIIAAFLIGVVIAGAMFGYSYYRLNRWIIIKDNPNPDIWDRGVVVNGELAQKNSAPCPDMILKQGKAKFLENTTNKGHFLLGYKITVGSEMSKQEKDASKYAPFLYQVRFLFTLIDKDGFKLQVLESPSDYDIFEISHTRTYQNVCPNVIAKSTAENSAGAYVTYILSATGPHSR